MIQVNNQKPTVLIEEQKLSAAGNFDPLKELKKTMIEPLMVPLGQGSVEIKIDNDTKTEDEILEILTRCGEDQIDIEAEKIMKEIFSQTLVYYPKNTTATVNEVFQTQAGTKEKMPEPTPTIVYTPSTDITPTCKEFIGGYCTKEKLFASFAYFAKPNTLGFYFAHEEAFNDFKEWLEDEINNIINLLTPETAKLFSEFYNLTLDQLTESLVIRNDSSQNNEEFSFARTLIAYLMLYTNQISDDLFGIFPFRLDELIIPKTVVFVNIEKHAKSSARKIKDEWELIRQSIDSKVKLVDTRKLKKLTSAARNIKKMQQNIKNMQQRKNQALLKASRARFRKSAPKTIDLARIIKRVLQKMESKNLSDNSYKAIKMSFARANRRDPDDFNKQGKSVSTKYKPDIHLFVDTSGSISEENYEEAVRTIIRMAQKLNVNLYFNSFSHNLSKPHKLELKNKSFKEIYKEFSRVPKVTGGTDYEQIWHFINNQKDRQRRLNIIMTDFEWSAPNKYVKHPKNLYYIPISNTDWDSIVYYAKNFCESMRNIDPLCRKRLLF